MIRTPFARWGPPRGKCSMSRRRFLHAAAGTLGALGAGFLCPTPVLAAGRDPKPIPAGLNCPGPADAKGTPDNPVGSSTNPGGDPSSITDFDGTIGVAHVQGTGTGTNTDTGDMSPLLFDSDLRFMRGVYRSVDGRFIEATLVLV
jgi:hypothetical protein